jgi:predicted nucleic acid-binding Zn ribbon protein
MGKHRNPRASVSAQPTPDNRRAALPAPEPDELDHLTYTLRDNLRRADAFISTAERQIEDNWHDDDSDEEDSEEDRKMRHRMRIEYLVEGGKYAVRAALYTVEQIDAVLTARRRRA